MTDPDMPAFPVVVPQGADGLVVRFADRLGEAANRAAIALSSALADGTVPGVSEVSSALASVYVRIDGDVVEVRDAVARLVAARDFTLSGLPTGRMRWHMPAAFGGAAGPMLEATARQAGHTPEQAVASLTANPLRVLAIGFAPGQPYLGELDPEWDIPRLSELVQVPRAALVVAIRQVVLFANPSPTGWSHIGQTAFQCFRPDSDHAFPLSPGDEILFEPVSADDLASLRATGDPDGGARREAIA